MLKYLSEGNILIFLQDNWIIINIYNYIKHEICNIMWKLNCEFSLCVFYFLDFISQGEKLPIIRKSLATFYPSRGFHLLYLSIYIIYSHCMSFVPKTRWISWNCNYTYYFTINIYKINMIFLLYKRESSVIYDMFFKC